MMVRRRPASISGCGSGPWGSSGTASQASSSLASDRVRLNLSCLLLTSSEVASLSLLRGWHMVAFLTLTARVDSRGLVKEMSGWLPMRTT